ncbi:MAG: tetratricopeptide repeat protein [Cyclobacteriaceae bacterium]|nr:tetratricopeptide repeat protein [Cyclobacteriaceae bacterium]
MQKESFIPQSDPLKALLKEAESNGTSLWPLVTSYVNLIASSNTQWIDFYWEKVNSRIKPWIGKNAIAEPLYILTQAFSNFFLTQQQESLNSFNIFFSKYGDSPIPNNIKGIAYMGRGSCYRSTGMIDKAMEDVIMAKAMIKNTEVEEWHIYIYRMTGEIHLFIGEYSQAEVHFLEAKTVLESIENNTLSTPKFRVYDGLATCYLKLGEKEKSLNYLEKALEVEDISPAEKARGLCDMGILFLDEPEKALPYLEKSCEIRKNQHLMDAYSTSLMYKGECFLKMGDYSNAEITLQETKVIIENYNVSTKKLHLYYLLKTLYENTNQYKLSLQYFNLYDSLQKEINAQQSRNIFKLKNNQIASQHEEIKIKHAQLKDTLNELARKAMVFSIITVVTLVILTEVFLDPVIEEYSNNLYLSLGSKVLIAFLLKPIDTMYERILFKRAVKDVKS